ncbi:MAG: AMP-binding protein [Chloroflexi bacterium]|nr:AMP-binding protein [Chloroflexota bacterium]
MAEEFYQADREAMTLAERERYYADRLQEIVAYAYERAPAVREKLERAGAKPGEIRTVADLARIPVTKKDDLVALQKAAPPFGGFLAVPPQSLKHVFFSPGPLYDPQGAEEDLARAAAKAFHAAGFGPGDIVINAFSYHLVPAGLLLDGALQALGATVVPTGVGNTDLQVKIMVDLRATGYVGTPSFLLTLLKRAEELGIPRPVLPLKRALFTAEPLPPSLRKAFEEDYGLATANAYATAELGLLGYECSQKSGFHIPAEVIVEITDPATGEPLGPGEPGEVVVTTFNRTYPLVRFGTGDLSAYTAEPCPCGRTSARLVAILGRVGDAVKVRGMFVHPTQLAEALSRFPEVARYQGVVTRLEHRDLFTLRVELGAEGADRQALSEGIQAQVRALCRVGLDRLEWMALGTIPAEAKKLVDERTWG